MKKSKIQRIDTVIGKNTTLTGNLVTKGSIKVDGKISGDVSCTGSLIVGISGKIEGNITAASIEIFGKISGNVSSEGTLSLHPKAKLIGDVLVKVFIADEGAEFEGNCTMQTPQAPEEKKKQRKL